MLAVKCVPLSSECDRGSPMVDEKRTVSKYSFHTSRKLVSPWHWEVKHDPLVDTEIDMQIFAKKCQCSYFPFVRECWVTESEPFFVFINYITKLFAKVADSPTGEFRNSCTKREASHLGHIVLMPSRTYRIMRFHLRMPSPLTASPSGSGPLQYF